MSFNEPYFAPMSNYSNTKKGMPMDEQEAWLDQFPQKRAENKPNGGIIQSLADTSAVSLRELSGKERKAARAKAQREHRQALKNLAKQREHDNKKIAKKLAEWRKEGKPQPTAEELAAKKEARRIRRNERNRLKREAEGKPVITEMPTQKGQDVLDQLKENGEYHVSQWSGNRKYLILIMSNARQIGYEIETVKAGRTVTHYKLTGNKKP